jgi:hypothetical protein
MLSIDQVAMKLDEFEKACASAADRVEAAIGKFETEFRVKVEALDASAKTMAEKTEKLAALEEARLKAEAAKIEADAKSFWAKLKGLF